MIRGVTKGLGDAGFLTLLGLIVTLAIICIMAYIVFNFYFKAPLLQDNIGNSLSVSEQGIDTSSYHSVIDTAKKKLEDVERQQNNNLKQMEDYK